MIVLIVKIGDQVYHSSEQPIVIAFEGQEAAQICNFGPQCDKFCAFPDTMDPSSIPAFMELPEDATLFHVGQAGMDALRGGGPTIIDIGPAIDTNE
jgi:hypothetical protein